MAPIQTGAIGFILVLSLIIAPSESCIPMIPPEDVNIIEFTASPVDMETTMEYCHLCEWSQINEYPFELGARLPESKGSIDAEGCQQLEITCLQEPSAFCPPVTLNAVTATDTRQIGTRTSVGVVADIQCNGRGDWSYEGTTINRVYCIYSACGGYTP